MYHQVKTTWSGRLVGQDTFWPVALHRLDASSRFVPKEHLMFHGITFWKGLALFWSLILVLFIAVEAASFGYHRYKVYQSHQAQASYERADSTCQAENPPPPAPPNTARGMAGYANLPNKFTPGYKACMTNKGQ